LAKSNGERRGTAKRKGVQGGKPERQKKRRYRTTIRVQKGNWWGRRNRLGKKGAKVLNRKGGEERKKQVEKRAQGTLSFRKRKKKEKKSGS